MNELDLTAFMHGRSDVMLFLGGVGALWNILRFSAIDSIMPGVAGV